MQQIEISIVLPALCAGLLVCATHVPLGIQVLRRGIVFIDIICGRHIVDRVIR